MQFNLLATVLHCASGSQARAIARLGRMKGNEAFGKLEVEIGYTHGGSLARRGDDENRPPPPGPGRRLDGQVVALGRDERAHRQEVKRRDRPGVARERHHHQQQDEQREHSPEEQEDRAAGVTSLGS